METFFKLKENGTTVSTEVIAGLTTFFAMAYIIAVNPTILSTTGMPWGAVFLATIITAIIGTLIMGLFANVPFGQAPGMGLNAFFTFTVVKGLGFTWQEAMCMVFICGILNIIITATKLRKIIIRGIPEVMKHAISGGIGIFIAYVGILNVGFIKFTPDETAPAGASPSIAILNTPSLWIFLISMAVVIFLLIFQFKKGGSMINRAAFLIAIIIATLIGIPMGVTTMSHSISLSEAFSQLPTTFMAIFRPEGFQSLFSNINRLPVVLVTILSFSLTDIFDTIGTLLGTGRRSGIFTDEDEKALENGKGFSSKMDKALFADATATSFGSMLGTSNITTYVESASGIAAGGRTGLTSVVISCCFALSIFLAPLFSAIPSAATAPVLVIVGCMMMAAFADIKWTELTDAIPAFFASIFMGLSYSISNGIAAGFITYILTKVFKREAKDIPAMIWVVAGLFIIDFAMRAIVTH